MLVGDLDPGLANLFGPIREDKSRRVTSIQPDLHGAPLSPTVVELDLRQHGLVRLGKIERPEFGIARHDAEAERLS